MAGVPNIFGNATTSIPLSNLDANFNTGLTIGNTTVGLGNTVTTLGNVTIANATTISAAGNVFLATSSGSVGIGTASPATTLDVAGNAVLSGTSGYKYLYFNSVTESSSLRFAKIGKNYDSTFDLGIWASTHTAGNSVATVFYRDLTTESMRIDSSGNLLVGQTSTTNAAKFAYTFNGGSASGISSNDSSASSGAAHARWLSNGTIVGSITTTSTATLYNVTSDYRLKTVIAPVSDAGTRIDALEPIEYDFKNGGRTRGFLAHKFAEVYPNSVSGEKDAVDKEGKPVYQAMQASTPEVMADLIAEIQSLRKRVATLEAK